jgi:hypothetical protein
MHKHSHGQTYEKNKTFQLDGGTRNSLCTELTVRLWAVSHATRNMVAARGVYQRRADRDPISTQDRTYHLLHYTAAAVFIMHWVLHFDDQLHDLRA